MRRIMLFVVAMTLLASMSSCLKNSNRKEDPTSAGWVLYVSVNRTNLVATDPMHVAFRLNVLLTEASKMENQNLALNEIVVTVDGKEQYLQTILFGQNKVESKGEGVYEIIYSNPSTHTIGVNDVLRDGTLVVSTGGKLLTKMGGNMDATWSVFAKNSEGYKVAFGAENTKVMLPVFESLESQSSVLSSYNIRSKGINEWSLYLNGFKAYVHEDYPSEWNLNFSFRHFPKVDQEEQELGTDDNEYPLDYADASTGHFEINGDAYGTPILINYGHRFHSTYTVSYSDPIVIKPSCGSIYAIFGGTERVTVDLDQDYPNIPSPIVTLEWESLNIEGKDCLRKSIICYNGWKLDSSVGHPVEDLGGGGIPY